MSEVDLSTAEASILDFEVQLVPIESGAGPEPTLREFVEMYYRKHIHDFDQANELIEAYVSAVEARYDRPVNERDADKAEIYRLRNTLNASDALLLEMNDKLDCAASQRDADKALIAELVEALEKARDLFGEIKCDFTDPRTMCRDGYELCDAAVTRAKVQP